MTGAALIIQIQLPHGSAGKDVQIDSAAAIQKPRFRQVQHPLQHRCVMDSDVARAFADKLEDMIRFLIPNYIKEGKTSLVIGIGCTGGKHRSVTIARELYSRLSKAEDYGIRLEHRDAEKDRLLKK